VKAYDANGMFGFAIARVTYVIDTAGIISAAFRHDVLVGKHVPLVLQALDSLKTKA
jgi:peroxiredoxin